MTLGKLIYNIIFKPTHNIRYNLAHFGVIGWLQYGIGENKMRNAAAKFERISITNSLNDIQVTYLTGEKYWHQTLFNIKSLHQQLNGRLRIAIYSDGTLNSKLINIMRNFCPQIRFVSEQDIVTSLDKKLPVSKYPSLRFMREWHPFLRKVIDVHLSGGWSVNLDSDMIFFDYPTEIITAFKNQGAIYMKELLFESYFVDTVDNLKNIHNINCIELVNGGVIGFNSDLVNYNELEEKASVLLNNYKHIGPARAEQTLESHILWQQNAQPLDPSKYRIFYEKKIGRNSNHILRHYIFKAKLPYFSKEWKTLIH